MKQKLYILKNPLRFMKTNFLIMMVFLFLINITNASPVTTNTPTIDITAGDSFYLNYTLVYEGSTSTQCYVSYAITPDSDGFQVTYVSPFTIQPNTNKYQIHINTDLALMPISYNITLTFLAESSSPVSIRHQIHNVYNATIPVIPPVDDTQPPQDDNNDIIPPIIILPGPPSNPDFTLIYALIGIIGICLITLLLIILKKRRKKQ